MKPPRLFLLLLAAAILAGGAGGHMLRRQARPPAAHAEIPPGQTTEPRRTGLPRSAPEADADPAVLRQWLDEAQALAVEQHSDLVMDAPHLLLALTWCSARDLSRLMEDVQRLPQGPARTRLEDWILKVWSERAPVAALGWTREHRPDKYPAAVEALARRDGAAAWQAVQEHPVPGDGAGDTASNIFSQWAVQDRMAALDTLLRMSPEKQESFRAGLGFYGHALPAKSEDPASWEAALAGMTQRVMQETDPKRRIAGVDLLKNAVEHQLSDISPAARRDELAKWLRSLPLEEKELSGHLTMVAQHGGSSAEEAPEAWPWLWREVPESQRPQTLKSIVEFWASEKPWSAKDPNACGQWLNAQMPLGTEHADALKDFAVHAAAADPASGLAWARANPDPATRAAATKEVQAVILKQWPHRAAELGVSSP